MSESGMRLKVTKALRSLDAIAVENPAYPGTPDVNYIGGWLELKWVRRWPEGEDTPLRLPHFTQQQKVWALRRERKGGSSKVLLQVGREWLLFGAEVAYNCLGNSPRHVLVAEAELVMTQGLDAERLIGWLRRRNS